MALNCFLAAFWFGSNDMNVIHMTKLVDPNKSQFKPNYRNWIFWWGSNPGLFFSQITSGSSSIMGLKVESNLWLSIAIKLIFLAPTGTIGGSCCSQVQFQGSSREFLQNSVEIHFDIYCGLSQLHSSCFKEFQSDPNWTSAPHRPLGVLCLYFHASLIEVSRVMPNGFLCLRTFLLLDFMSLAWTENYHDWHPTHLQINCYACTYSYPS